MWLVVAALCAIGTVGPHSVAWGTSPGEVEYELKAAFTFNFLRFIEWPEHKIQANRVYDQAHGPGGQDAHEAETLPPLRIGIIGENPFGRAWDPIAERTILDREIVVAEINGMARYTTDPHEAQNTRNRYYRKYAAELRRCDLVFISTSEDMYLEMLLGLLAGHAVATVSDVADFAQRGGMLGLVMEQQRVRFDISLGHSNDEQIDIRSQLLQLARYVHRPESSRDVP